MEQAKENKKIYTIRPQPLLTVSFYMEYQKVILKFYYRKL